MEFRREQEEQQQPLSIAGDKNQPNIHRSKSTKQLKKEAKQFRQPQKSLFFRNQNNAEEGKDDEDYDEIVRSDEND